VDSFQEPHCYRWGCPEAGLSTAQESTGVAVMPWSVIVMITLHPLGSVIPGFGVTEDKWYPRAAGEPHSHTRSESAVMSLMFLLLEQRDM